jgi:antitoxin (DNA-binding transcriptional repressor) of toxin-antitoxin stability system
MRSVKIADLKAKLSAHIQLVRDGEEVVICDRDVPVARMIPIEADFSEQDTRLIARGVMTLPLRRRKSSEALPQPPGNIPDEVMQRIWREEREGR